jgi:hypothetical protein
MRFFIVFSPDHDCFIYIERAPEPAQSIAGVIQRGIAAEVIAILDAVGEIAVPLIVRLGENRLVNIITDIIYFITCLH